MEVNLSSASRETIETLVREGDFASVDQALEAAVDLLAERNQYRQRLNALLDEGLEDIRAGRVVELTLENKDQILADIVARGRARRAAKSRE